MRRRALLAMAAFSLTALGICFLVLQLSISAMAEPGGTESYLAAKLKHVLVHRSSRYEIPPPPRDVWNSITEGDKLYGVECSMCHGLDGHTPTDAGRWMYPRAANLASAGVQRYSDAELFWIVKNGVRLSGMPAFGKVESDEHIWNLVHYVRSLGDTQDRANKEK